MRNMSLRRGFGFLVIANSWIILIVFTTVQRQSLAAAETENLCANCTSNCDEATGVCSGKCKNNHYGEKCQYGCKNCKRRCDKETGKCLACWYGTYGEYCNGTCGEGCYGCDQKTGVCGSCRSGYFGDFCKSKCPSGCHYRCNKEGKCTYCRGDKWGPRCEKNCPVNCDYGCNVITGKCTLCKASYRGEFCEIRCNDTNCEKCYETNGGEVCYSCLKGYFGDHCELNCSRNCRYDYCSQSSGECSSCKDGWFGNKCENNCHDNCARCIDNTTCMQCMDGYHGGRCENKCGAGCKRCSRDGHKCERCSSDDAKSWYSQNCDCTVTECSPHKYDCKSCNKLSWFNAFYVCCPCNIQHCVNVTVDDSNCGNRSSAECSECQPGYFGHYCSSVCSPHCGGKDRACGKETGNCSEPCEEGWYGASCNIHCRDFFPHCTQCETVIKEQNSDVKCTDCEKGYYVKYDFLYRCDKCEHCVNDVCNVTSGECLEGCEKGFYKDYKKHCTKECGNCIDEDCHDNGTCVARACKTGHTYYRQGCFSSCPSNCLANQCDAETGDCLIGCKQGYFGKRCYSKCKNCRDDLCNHTTGECFECKRDFWGHKCERSCKGCIDEVCTHPEGCRHGCKLGLHSKFCNQKCPSECSACDQFFGTCSVCKVSSDTTCLDKQRQPWTLSPSNFPSNGSCTRGKYGPNCNITCPSGCSANENKSPICDRYTGTCLFSGCVQSQYGMYCEKNCPFCDQEDGNDTQSCDRKNGHCYTCGDIRYGTFCENKCKDTCLDSMCLQYSGSCLRGCREGWAGQQCQVKLEIPEESTLWQTVVAVVVPVVVIVAIAIIIFIFCKARIKEPRYESTSSNEIH